MLAVAHRGCWWPHSSRQNTVGAMQQAVDLGFGIEIDVHRVKRLSDSKTVDGMAVGHNVSEECENGWPLFPGSYLQVFASAPLILWDIKSPGLAQMLPKFLFTHDLQDKSIIFDQDFPGMPEGYSNDFWDWSKDLKLLARLSERDLPNKVIGSAYYGVWLDQFEVDWVGSDVIQYFHDRGKVVFVVSSELHNRILDLAKWKEWVQAEVDGLCTDFPDIVYGLSRTNMPLHPQQPWWQQEEWKATLKSK